MVEAVGWKVPVQAVAQLAVAVPAQCPGLAGAVSSISTVCSCMSPEHNAAGR